MDAHKARMRQSSADPNWRTDPRLYAALAQLWHFDLDLAATADNAKVYHTVTIDGSGTEYTDDTSYEESLYLGPDHPVAAYRDALTVPWHQLGQTGFINPPYSISRITELWKEIKLRTANGMTPFDREILLAQIRALRIISWAEKAYNESLLGFTTIGVFPYAPQTIWFRRYVMGHDTTRQARSVEQQARGAWNGHAALDYWRIPHRVNFLRPDGTKAANANVNTCIIHWGPNPGFVGPWVPSGRYWSYR